MGATVHVVVPGQSLCMRTACYATSCGGVHLVVLTVWFLVPLGDLGSVLLVCCDMCVYTLVKVLMKLGCDQADAAPPVDCSPGQVVVVFGGTHINLDTASPHAGNGGPESHV